VPGSIVKREDGKKIETLTKDKNTKVIIDLEHDNMPDPIAEALLNLHTQIKTMEEKIERLERESHAEKQTKDL
jgi:serine O-acetyltransferase